MLGFEEGKERLRKRQWSAKRGRRAIRAIAIVAIVAFFALPKTLCNGQNAATLSRLCSAN
jgi:hypothetical protein